MPDDADASGRKPTIRAGQAFLKILNADPDLWARLKELPAPLDRKARNLAAHARAEIERMARYLEPPTLPLDLIAEPTAPKTSRALLKDRRDCLASELWKEEKLTRDAIFEAINAAAHEGGWDEYPTPEAMESALRRFAKRKGEEWHKRKPGRKKGQR